MPLFLTHNLRLFVASRKANEIEISNLRDDHPLRARTLMSWGNIYLGESTDFMNTLDSRKVAESCE